MHSNLLRCACPWFCWTLWVCAACLTSVAGTQDGLCEQQVLIAAQRRLEPGVVDLAELHFNNTSGRHYEVVEVISVFHVDRLCRSALRYLEALRLTLGLFLCPARFQYHFRRSDSGVIEGAAGLERHFEQYFADLHSLIYQTGDLGASDAKQWWDSSMAEIGHFSRSLARMALTREGSRSTYATIEPLLQRIIDMIVDFGRAVVLDLNALFLMPNYVARDMLPLPGPEGAAAAPARPAMGVSIFASDTEAQALDPDFLAMLKHPPTTLSQPSISAGSFGECRHMPPVATANTALPLEFMDVPPSWAHRDVTGVVRRTASPLQLLQACAQHARLSNLLVSVQVALYLLSPPPWCGAKEALYDPSHCLIDQGWGAYFLHANPLPPYNFSVTYSGKPLGPGATMPKQDIHSIHVPSMEIQWRSLISVYKSVNHHSPDLLFVSPLVGNCALADRLLKTGSIRPKLIHLPINPLATPPREVVPDFVEWWKGRETVLLSELAVGWSPSASDMPVITSVWLAQCSLAASARILQGHRYALVNVEHTFAVFMTQTLHDKVFGVQGASAAPAADRLHSKWLSGWRCSPHARYLFDLEAFAGTDHELVGTPSELPLPRGGAGPATGELGLTRETAREHAAALVEDLPTLRYFLERRRDEEGRGRGRCGQGFCECLPPYRGRFCEHLDRPRAPQALRAVIHYVTAETERDLVDLERSLSTLWERFNHRHDYPVVVFHEGISPAARKRIVYASENRLWLALLPRFQEVPAEWAAAAQERAQDFSVGYRAMTRWRSGPVFLEPALAGFDYAMTLDTDSYFPADLGVDPFELVHGDGLVAAFPHLGRESASVVVNFMHYFLLYCRTKGLHPRRTRMLEGLIEKNFKWYQQCLMLDIEILKLEWFRGEAYQDIFRYMDSTGGFWLHRWGNNAVRTFAVALLLQDREVRSLELPYAHQDYCSCGPDAWPCTWDSQRRMYQCEVAPAAAPLAGWFADLAEGFLDLQPWRGNDRQKTKLRDGGIPVDML